MGNKVLFKCFVRFRVLPVLLVEGYPSEPKSAGDAAEKMGGLSLQGGAPTEAKPKKPVMLMDKKTMAVSAEPSNVELPWKIFCFVFF